MEFYRWNGSSTKAHIALDVDGAVCGFIGHGSQAQERFKLHHNGYIYSMDYHNCRYEITDQIDCKKCLRWYIKSRFSGEFLDHKL